jgi:hypothetical protein
MKIRILSFVLISLWLNTVSSQVGIGTTTPDQSAVLDLTATNQGLLIPRVTIDNALEPEPVSNPATGLLVYNTNNFTTNTDAPYGASAGFYFWNGDRWERLRIDNKNWSTAGNAGTDTNTNFLGTTDATDLILKTNNIERLRINSSGGVSINNLTPPEQAKLSAFADNNNWALNSIAADEAVNLYNYNFGSGQNSVFYTDNNTNSLPVIYTVHNGSGPTLQANAAGSDNNGIEINFSNNNQSGTGLFINDAAAGTTSGTNRKGINVVMNQGNTNVAYLGTQLGTGRVAQFLHEHPSTTEPSVFIQNNSASNRALNVQTMSATSVQPTLFALQRSQGIHPVTYQAASAIYGVSDGLYGGIFYANGLSNQTVALSGTYGGNGLHDGVGVAATSTPAEGWGIGLLARGNYLAVAGIGDMQFSGTKNFVIDHPLDPHNKTLRHFAIESNEVLNIYRGNVMLDDFGEAVVELPEYFTAININYSYNLTPIGAYAQLYIAEEIDNNGRFKISGGQPHMKVSWYVCAERNDVYLQQNPHKKETEVRKRDFEAGRYYYPEGFNQPQELQIFSELSSREPLKNNALIEDNNTTSSQSGQNSEKLEQNLSIIKKSKGITKEGE